MFFKRKIICWYQQSQKFSPAALDNTRKGSILIQFSLVNKIRVAHVFLVFRWSTERSYQCIKLKIPRRGHFFKFSAGLQSARTNAENSKSPRRGHFLKFSACPQSARTNAENSKSPAAATFLSFLLVYRALVPMQKTQNHPAAVTFLF